MTVSAKPGAAQARALAVLLGGPGTLAAFEQRVRVALRRRGWIEIVHPDGYRITDAGRKAATAPALGDYPNRAWPDWTQPIHADMAPIGTPGVVDVGPLRLGAVAQHACGAWLWLPTDDLDGGGQAASYHAALVALLAHWGHVVIH